MHHFLIVYVGNVEICIDEVRGIIFVQLLGHFFAAYVYITGGTRSQKIHFSNVAFVVITERSLLSKLEIITLFELRIKILD